MGNWLGVPWMMENAVVSGDLGRLIAHVAFNGKEGIVDSNDLRVLPLDVPGSQIKVMPGACSIVNRAANRENQMYAAMLPNTDLVDIAATGSSAGRSDLIIVRVENPYLAGEPWQIPADADNGPYVYTRVIPGVPAGTTSIRTIDPGSTAITLARVDIPKATGAITGSMIKDMRFLQAPKTDTEDGGNTKDPSESDNDACPTTPSNNTGFQNWPSQCVFNLNIPSYCTRVKARIEIIGTAVATSFFTGQMCLQLGGTNGTVRPLIGLWPGAEVIQPLVCEDVFTIPKSLRGKTMQLRLITRRTAGTGSIKMKPGARVIWKADYGQQPTYD